MPHLSLVLLGSFQATLDSQPITSWKSNKIKALLTYLAVEADRPHPREALAGLLWPDYPNASALNNLRDALAALRQAIGDRQAEPPFLLITRDTIQFNTASDYALDLTGFQNLSGLSDDHLEQVMARYRGSFLEGFSCDSAPFEEWVLVKREQINRQTVDALCRLAKHFEDQGEYERAIAYARKQLELEPWDEPAHRQLMRALVLNGQRSAALAQYETCRRLLMQELGVEPSGETTALYESIRDEKLIAAHRPRALATREEPPAQTIKGYELIEQIGQGAFGVIYRARQRHVDRQVAIKVILPEHANQPDFIRRFETEAQLVAQLEHLHIVPLYDYWREPDGAYLVMRLMKGGSLEKLLDRGPLGLSETARIMAQIGSALAAAHRQGVIHRDLKPANILLDEEGNAYLSDFGIAKASVQPAQITATGAIVGTPAYISPEQLQSQVLTPQADIYSLGVLLFEMLTGQHPFKGSSTGDLIVKHLTTPLPPLREVRPDLPTELDRVIQCATAKDPMDRYADVMSLVADLDRALAPEVATRPVVPTPELPLVVTNPYKGLRAFQEADALDFFGREALTQQLLARMGDSPSPALAGEGVGGWGRFLAVVGPSGSGKSSIVRAGLVPAIRHGALPGSDQWFVVEMLPGQHPLEELEIGLLRIAARQHSGLMEQLKRDVRGLVRAARLVLPSDDSTLLLLVDQFEELFTLVQDKDEAWHFLDSLYAAVTDPRSPVRVIITLRADFYDRPLMHPEFSALMSKRTQVVTPLTTDELARAIAGPAERVGAALESGLVTGIVTDVKEQPGALPLLQYALTELFERREGRLLTRQAYQSIGGVMGALGRRAEEVYASLDPSGQEAARQLFLRLVTLGEGVEDTRRRVLRSELESLLPAISNQKSGIGNVIEAFGKSRLLSFDRDPLTRGPTVQVAHEALLREWKRLHEWLEASRADVRLQRLLAAAVSEWTNANREPSFLLQGARLAQFEGWATGATLALTQDERAFLDACLAERQKRETEEAVRQRRELEAAQKLAETEKHRAEEQARAATELRQRAVYLTVALAVAAVLAMAAALFGQRAQSEGNRANAEKLAALNAGATAVAARDRAETEAHIATSRELAAAAVNNLQVDPERSVLLALQALSTADTLEANNALHQALPELHILRTIPAHDSAVTGAAFNPDGTRIATSSADKTAKMWDAATGKLLFTLMTNETVWDAVFSPDGKRLATSGFTEVILWDAATGQKQFTLSGKSPGAATGFDIGVGRIRFSPDGTRLAVANMDGVPKVWDLSTRTEVFSLTGHKQICKAIAYSPDGKLLATGSDDGIVKLWDAQTGKELLTLTGHKPLVRGVAFSPDGTRLVSVDEGAVLKVWQVATGQELLKLDNPTAGGFRSAVFMPDGKSLVAVGYDGTARMWDAASGRQLLTLAGHNSTVTDVALSPAPPDGGTSGMRLATVSADTTLRIWDPGPGRELLTLTGHTAGVNGVSYNPDGTRLATSSDDGTVKIWNPASGQLLQSFAPSGQQHPWGCLAYSPDGKRVAAGSNDGVASVWDAASGTQVITLTAHTNMIRGVAFSPDGTRLATGGLDGTAKVWDIESGKALVTFSGHIHPEGTTQTNSVWSVAFSPDGKRVATGGFDAVRVWDADTGQELLSLPGEGNALIFTGLAFSPDGKLVAVGQFNGLAVLWDAATGKLLRTLSGHSAAIVYVAFNSDGTRLASASFDKLAKVWDVKTGQEITSLYGNASNVTSASFSPDGTHLATAGTDETARIYTLQMEDLVKLARSRMTRSLTTEECRKYLHVETCPPAP
jgi:WD40 repeat protein/DNA-binding SARP family transcriptional activator/tRNA A-37 threonylcarbamoyl transferase component Bud32